MLSAPLEERGHTTVYTKMLLFETCSEKHETSHLDILFFGFFTMQCAFVAIHCGFTRWLTCPEGLAQPALQFKAGIVHYPGGQ